MRREMEKERNRGRNGGRGRGEREGGETLRPGSAGRAGARAPQEGRGDRI